MNHITKLTLENNDLREQVRRLEDELRELSIYLCSEKFRGPANDYVHVRNDVLPKIERIRFLAIEG